MQIELKPKTKKKVRAVLSPEEYKAKSDEIGRIINEKNRKLWQQVHSELEDLKAENRECSEAFKNRPPVIIDLPKDPFGHRRKIR
jgi:hypothetical protein